MLQIEVLLDQLREWAEQDPDSASGVSTMLLGILAPGISLSPGEAPAHPEEMRAWLIRIISAHATSAISNSSSPVLPIGFNNLAQILPLVLRNTEPSDWPRLSTKVRLFRGVISYSKDEGIVQAMLEDSQVQQFLRALGGVSIEASGWSKTRVRTTLQEHWRWPLSIVVDDIWLTDRRIQRFCRLLDHLGFARLVPYGNGQPGAIRLIAGNANEVMRALESADKGRYAFILGTGTFDKVRDLKRITNKARSAGAAMLGWEPSNVSRQLVAMLARIQRSVIGTDTLDVWLNQPRDTGLGMLYADPDALSLTAPREAGNMLFASLMRQYLNTTDAGSRSVQARSLDPRNPLNIIPNDVFDRAMPDSRDGAAIWLRRVGEVTYAATAAGLLAPPRAFGLIDESDLNIGVRSATESAIFVKTAGPIAPDGSDKRIGAINFESLVTPRDIVERLPASVAPQVPQARQVSVQATLMCEGRPMDRLNATAAHVLQVQLAAADLQAVKADSPFPVDRLPAEDSSVPLTIFLVPLAGIQPQHRGIALRSDCVFSKLDAKSGLCRFSLITAPNAIEYKARLLILHANRVLQSLMLQIPGTHAHEGAVMHLVAENIVHADFSHLTEERAYDLAIVSNHNEAAQKGFMMVTKDKVEFREPKSFAGKLAAVSAQLKTLNDTSGNGTAKGRHAQLTYSLNELANLGNDMRELLCGGNRDLEVLTADHGDPSNPVRIQVMEAVADAFLPVEIFYDGPAPQPEAPLCAKASSPDYPMRTCGGCVDRQRDDLICPSRFWGLSKVIERRPYVADAVSNGADYAVSVPQLRYAKVPAFRSIVYGLSKKFERREHSGITASLKKLSRQVISAGSWEAWKVAVAQHGPEMLVAIGHVEQRLNAIDALEIGDEHLRSTNITSSHIRKSEGAVPVVVLLGCGTLYAENELGNFVRHFSRHGAGLIVATIASMLTLQAQLCVDAITQAFNEARTSGAEGDRDGHNTVGFAVLRAKQALLAAGSGLGLALTGAGDSEWEF
jgi:hypothetical protein